LSTAVPTVPASINQFILSGMLDGGSACLGETSYHQTFTLINPTTATFTVETVVINLHVESASVPAGQIPYQLNMTSNIYACANLAFKVADFGQSYNGSTNTGGDSESASSTAEQIVPFVVDNFSGDYSFDSTCKPSTKCCCGQGTLSVSRFLNSTALAAAQLAAAAADPGGNTAAGDITAPLPGQMFSDMTSSLDGGSACLGQPSIQGVLGTVNDFTMDLIQSGITFTAHWSKDYSHVNFTDSYHGPTCVSTAIRSASRTGKTSHAPQSLAPSFSSLLTLAAWCLAVRCFGSAFEH